MDTEHDEDDEDEFFDTLNPLDDEALPAQHRAERAEPDEKRAQREEDRARNLFRRLNAYGISLAQFAELPLSMEARNAAFDAAGKARFAEWCSERGATPKEIRDRMFTDDALRVVTEIDDATSDLMKVLTRLRKLGLSESAASNWVAFHTDLRWRYGIDDEPCELPTLERFLEHWSSGKSGLRPVCSHDAYRKRRSDYKARLVALRKAVGDEWADVVLKKMGLALEVVCEANDSVAPCDRGDVESALRLMCELLGLDVSRSSSRS